MSFEHDDAPMCSRIVQRVLQAVLHRPAEKPREFAFVRRQHNGVRRSLQKLRRPRYGPEGVRIQHHRTLKTP